MSHPAQMYGGPRYQLGLHNLGVFVCILGSFNDLERHLEHAARIAPDGDELPERRLED